MTAVNERTIAEELRRLAAEARPVDARAHARRAVVRSSRRRRLSWSVVAAAVAAVAVVAGFFGGEVMTAQVAGPPPSGLPANTPGQLQTVRGCMPAGGPSVNTNPHWRDPAHGTVDDFRLLVESRDKDGFSALLGSVKGFVLCTPSAETQEPPVFTYWGNKAPGALTGFSGTLGVDVYNTHYWYDPDPPRHDGYVRIVAGRVAPGVKRVTVDWSGGKRADAVIAHGFFLARTPAYVKKGKDFLDTPPVTVTAYDAAGQATGRHRDVPFLWRGPVGP